jgi:hypothetical protein
MYYHKSKILLLFSFFFFSYGMITLYKEMGFVVIPIIAIFLYLPLILKVFFFANLNFDFKGLKMTYNLNQILNIISEIFLVIITTFLTYSALITYNVKDKDNIQNMFPYVFIALAVITYFVASGIINHWKVFIGPIMGSILVFIYFAFMKANNLV